MRTSTRMRVEFGSCLTIRSVIAWYFVLKYIICIIFKVLSDAPPCPPNVQLKLHGKLLCSCVVPLNVSNKVVNSLHLLSLSSRECGLICQRTMGIYIIPTEELCAWNRRWCHHQTKDRLQMWTSSFEVDRWNRICIYLADFSCKFLVRRRLMDLKRTVWDVSGS